MVEAKVNRVQSVVVLVLVDTAVGIMCTVCRVRIVVLNLLAVSFVEGQGRSLER